MTAAPVIEEVLSIGAGSHPLVGIVSLPDQRREVGMVIAVGGPQYRVGSHRQFVLLARHLAACGHAVLRFDFRGMGDSAGAPNSFEQTQDDLAHAIDALMARCPNLKGIALWGLCDGASAALLYWNRTHDPRVLGLALANPWVRNAALQAKATVKHYYVRRLLQADFWRKLGRGRVGGAALRDLATNVRRAFGRSSAGEEPNGRAVSFQQRMAQGWKDFRGGILLILSGNDLTAREFVEATRSDPAWAGRLEDGNVVRCDVPGADHTFSASEDTRHVERLTSDWLASLAVPIGSHG